MHCAGAALRDSGAHPTESLPDAEVAVGAAGPALYLVGQVLVRLRLLGCIYWVRLGGAVACILVGVSAPSLACCSRHSCKTASAGAPEDGASTQPLVSSRRIARVRSPRPARRPGGRLSAHPEARVPPGAAAYLWGGHGGGDGFGGGSQGTATVTVTVCVSVGPGTVVVTSGPCTVVVLAGPGTVTVVVLVGPGTVVVTVEAGAATVCVSPETVVVTA